MKQMVRARQIIRDTDSNCEGTGNYKAWADYTEYEIELCDRSNSKLTANIIYANMLSQADL